ncbi:fibroblast growth factor 19-like [Eleutherodactylus coqui]|uniref:fibroblast growth factor 19-like n=1 Tax=Eleutherodactylus coqui TaxID=57060 RepID=UPI00346243B6
MEEIELTEYLIDDDLLHIVWLKVQESDSQDHGVLEIKAIKPSILVIRGIKTTRYLCMDSGHHLYGATDYKEDDCNFRETPENDGYNLYHSEKHRAVLSLTPTRGNQMVRFIPLKNSIPLESLYREDDSYDPQFNENLHREDPLGMIGSIDIYSPSQDS